MASLETTQYVTTKPVSDELLADWRERALSLEEMVAGVVVDQARAIRLLNIAVFARGHVLLEGDVGVGKTTLLRALARTVGGAYERIEGTIDLLPSDLIYYTYLSESGEARVAPGPLLKSGQSLSIFFFNEINRARPQVHSLLLRVMAERRLGAFNREYHLPHLLVFADRNRIEKEETFELPSAARDRFLMEVTMEAPTDRESLEKLMFDTRYHDTESLLQGCRAGVLEYERLNEIGAALQTSIQVRPALRDYALNLVQATRCPADFGVEVEQVDIDELVQAGASPRGMSMLLRAARVAAWLRGGDVLLPEDLREVFHEVMVHRVFFTPVYEIRRAEIAPKFMQGILHRVATP